MPAGGARRGPIRAFLAPNSGPLTLGGTIAHVVGDRVAAVIDPGPRILLHLDRLAAEVADADEVSVLLTHGHSDHAGGAAYLADALGAEVLGPGGGRDLEDGDRVRTSCGDLVAVSTPGHARRHFCYHLVGNGAEEPDGAGEARGAAPDPRGAVFVGDLVLGFGSTTWVGEYPGAVADYLASLDRLESLGARVLHPAHGPPIRDPGAAIARFRRHRLDRIEMVRRAVEDGCVGADAIVARVYGDLPDKVRSMAASGVTAMLDHIGAAK